ncbi:hypothetical protein LCGC14_1503300 [marine sediment metagenome]|uniref:Uncharacterized protein n=1 Tax=marine sediment metagenome TaxID=412755 RepID=A0A0F9LIZ9_9ZZZZ
MAIFLPGPIVGEIRGSEGGTTFSRNRFGQYTRQRSIPVNPNTGRQASARSRLAGAAILWSLTLTQVQRDAWDLYATSIIWINALGQPVSLPGFQFFIRMFTAFLQAGIPAVLDGPTTLALPSPDSTFAASISEATQLISVVFDNTLAWANQDDGAMMIHMAQPRGAGRKFIGPPTRFAGAIFGNSTTPPTSPQTIAVPFAVAVDQNTDVKYRIGEADGRLSGLFLDAVSVAV